MAPSPMKKARIITPKDLNDSFASWVPGGLDEDNADLDEMLEVVADTVALGKRKHYLSSVCLCLYLHNINDDSIEKLSNRTSPWRYGEKDMYMSRSS